MIRFEKTKKMYGIPKTAAQSLYDLDLVLDFYLNKMMPILSAKLKVDLIEAQEKFKEFIEIDRLVMSVCVLFLVMISTIHITLK